MAWTTPAGPRGNCAPSRSIGQSLAKTVSDLFLHGSRVFLLCSIFAIVAPLIAFAIAVSQPDQNAILVGSLVLGLVVPGSFVVYLHRKKMKRSQPAIRSRWAKVSSYQCDVNGRIGRPIFETAPPTPHVNERWSERANPNSPSHSSHLNYCANQDANGHAQLLACMSHEFRTPLNAVIGFTDLMQKELFGPLGSPRYQEYVQHIKDCGSALLKSTEDTLAMTSALTEKGRRSLSAEAVPLQQTAHEAWSALRPVRNATAAKLVVAIAPDLQVLMDRPTLRQVLLNVYNEALANLGPSNVVQISATADQELVQIEVSATEPASDPLPYTKSPVENTETSLSLCLARTLLELHGLSLLLMPKSSGAWRAITVLDRAAQKDFFERAHEPGQSEMEPDCPPPLPPEQQRGLHTALIIEEAAYGS